MTTLSLNLANVSRYGHTETGILIIDLALLAGLLLIALRNDWFLQMWATAFQIVAVTVHIASLTETGKFVWAYAVGLIFWSYPVLIASMVGTSMEARSHTR